MVVVDGVRSRTARTLEGHPVGERSRVEMIAQCHWNAG